ncbi:septation protein A [Sphingomicrobium marinum]|uniref:septation protein A n=1 Tax=Sphingomicrobium marinum TaxID=1227950 RepID=UPI00223F586F|nr:septation protein A [Sphingomicrobium marinum]
MSDVNPGPSIEQEKREGLSTGKQLLLDLGPLILFFLANKFAPVPDAAKIFAATGVFMVAIIVAMAITYAAVRHVTTMQIFSAVLVLIMGGLTIYLQSEMFIKIKPTLFYGAAAIVLFVGLFTGRPLLKALLGSAYPGLSERGWMLLTRNWAFFFVAMAILNEFVWRNFTTDQWIGFKIWGMLPLTFVFAAANVPMLMRHGLNVDPEAKKAE